MEFLIFMALLYFLPTIVAMIFRPRHDPQGLFLVNFFFGLTIIGWWVALIWAIASKVTSREVRTVPASSGWVCTQCGALSPYGAHFCSACGHAV